MVEIVITCDKCGRSRKVDASLYTIRLNKRGEVEREEKSVLQNIRNSNSPWSLYYEHVRVGESDHLLCRYCAEVYKDEIRDAKNAVSHAQSALVDKKREFFEESDADNSQEVS